MKLEFLELSVFSDSETLFKCKNWWSKCLQEIVLVHHFIVPCFPIQMSVQKFSIFANSGIPTYVTKMII